MVPQICDLLRLSTRGARDVQREKRKERNKRYDIWMCL